MESHTGFVFTIYMYFLIKKKKNEKILLHAPKDKMMWSSGVHMSLHNWLHTAY